MSAVGAIRESPLREADVEVDLRGFWRTNDQGQMTNDQSPNYVTLFVFL
ncbi:hypothetical protein [[Phormidium] sp. ETS-05]|nr:hypothetical protein [[Phormidium] sp. ETS-05]